jgi:hypothetical protein
MSRFGIEVFSVSFCGFFLAAGALAFGFNDQENNSPGSSAPARVAVNSSSQAESRPSRMEARQRAEMLHDLIHQMLLDVHEHYYREDEGLLLPATTLRGTFEKFAERQKTRIRWLAVDAEPMNIDHRPQGTFDLAAVEALKAGQSAFDEASEGQYRYAGPIKLTSECLKCHVPNRTSTRDRLAGIVISMPFAEATRAESP